MQTAQGNQFLKAKLKNNQILLLQNQLMFLHPILSSF